MRLLYIYLDFTLDGHNPEGYHGHEKCELNFSPDNVYTLKSENSKYTLKCVERQESDKIEQGFWGDNRIYNVSALVGENGTGKTTLLQAIIGVLRAANNGGKPNVPFDFACLIQDDQNELYFFSSWKNIDVCVSGFICKEILCPNNFSIIKSILQKTKIIYFSNAISAADMEQTVRNRDEKFLDLNERYIYDCSLFSLILESQNVSNGPKRNDSLENLFRTYFTFQSYQEARYLFDRNQRILLLHMKSEGYPVPLPRKLKIAIRNSQEHIQEVIHTLNGTYNFSDWLQQYDHFCEDSKQNYFAVTELSINCVANFIAAAECNHCTDIHKIVFGDEFISADSYIQAMSSILLDDVSSELQCYYERCEQYIRFLWNNENLIRKYWVFNGTDYYITLGENLDSILEELMIRFIDLNRAVSVRDYFVFYQWGLSSGENVLLNMFTKFRYLLQGNSYDKEDPNPITKETIHTKVPVKRNEFIANYDKDIIYCDSVILFLDEADLSLHPEWQRMFIATLMNFLPKIYRNPYYDEASIGCKNIQIVLTTHSPLMLGDFPAASVIYLKKNENGLVEVESNNELQPFGQNLYTLLKDGFYLRNGTIGALAQNKIISVLETVRNIREKLTTLDEKASFDEWKSVLEEHKRKTIKYLPKGIVRNKLEEEITTLALTLQKRDPSNKALQKQKLKEDIARLQKQLNELDQEETAQ